MSIKDAWNLMGLTSQNYAKDVSEREYDILRQIYRIVYKEESGRFFDEKSMYITLRMPPSEDDDQGKPIGRKKISESLGLRELLIQNLEYGYNGISTEKLQKLMDIIAEIPKEKKEGKDEKSIIIMALQTTKKREFEDIWKELQSGGAKRWQEKYTDVTVLEFTIIKKLQEKLKQEEVNGRDFGEYLYKVLGLVNGRIPGDKLKEFTQMGIMRIQQKDEMLYDLDYNIIEDKVEEIIMDALIIVADNNKRGYNPPNKTITEE